MPTFNLQLEFDDRGAVVAVRKLNDITSAADQAQRSIGGISHSTDNLANSLSGAAKKLTALVGVYKALDKAMSFAARGNQFNASLEESRIGMASLITSMVKLSDAQGKALDGAEKYAAAQGIAAGMMREIQQLGLETTATAQSLVEGTQMIMGPAIQAGMALEKIPQFAVAGAQAMQTLGVPLNQMRTELDALLSASVNKTQDILAPKLFADVKGDLNEYLRGLKESGTLIDEIMRRLEPFQLAGKDVANTWTGLMSNLGEAIDKIAGEASKGLSEKLKESVRLMQNMFVATEKIDGKDVTKVSSQFENILSLLTELENRAGEAIVASMRQLSDMLAGINSFIGAGSAAMIDDLVEALKLCASAFLGVKAAALATFAKNGVIGAINGAKNSMDAFKQSQILAAQASVNMAKAQRAQYQSFLMSSQGQSQLNSGAAARNSLLHQQQIYVDRLAAAEARLAQAQKMGAASGASGVAMTGLKGLASLLGGPFNIAVGAATMGLAYMATRQNEAEKAAQAHEKALASLAVITEEAAKQGANLAAVLSETAEAERRIALASAQEALQGFINAMRELNLYAKDAGQIQTYFDEITGPSDQMASDIQKLIARLDAGQISVADFRQQVAALYNELDKKGEAGGKLGENLKALLDLSGKAASVEETIRRLSGALEDNSQALATNVKIAEKEKDILEEMGKGLELLNVKEKEHANSLEGAIAWLQKRTQGTKDGKKAQEEMASATDRLALSVLNLKIIEAEACAAALNFEIQTGEVTDALIKKANDANDTLVKLIKARETFTAGLSERASTEDAKAPEKSAGAGGGRSVASFDDSAERWRELENQLAQLTGASSGARESLEKTLKSVEETGRAAGKSAQEIAAMKAAFSKASDDRLLMELNSELARAQGNVKKLAELESADKNESFKARLADVQSISTTEKDSLALLYESALARQAETNELGAQLDFLKELESMGLRQTQTQELQNRLIDLQAQELANQLGPEMAELVAQWAELKKRQEDVSDPFAGMANGLKKYADDAANVASQMENAIGGAFQGMEDAFVKFAQTGKLSFNDMANSIIADLTRIAVRSMITGPLASAIGNVFGGFFSGGGSGGVNYTAAQKATMSANGMQSGYGGWLTGLHGHAHGAVFSGGDIGSYSGKIVAGPTLFSYESQLARFAKGAGLMGEAGAEAIMPLARTSAGDLGVRVADNWQAPERDFAGDLLAFAREARDKESSRTPQVAVNIINNSDARVESGETRPDGNGGFSMDVIVSQVESSIVGRMKHGKSQIAQYQERAYSMSRAPTIARGKGRN